MSHKNKIVQNMSYALCAKSFGTQGMACFKQFYLLDNFIC